MVLWPLAISFKLSYTCSWPVRAVDFGYKIYTRRSVRWTWDGRESWAPKWDCSHYGLLIRCLQSLQDSFQVLVNNSNNTAWSNISIFSNICVTRARNTSTLAFLRLRLLNLSGRGLWKPFIKYVYPFSVL